MLPLEVAKPGKTREGIKARLGGWVWGVWRGCLGCVGAWAYDS